VIATGVAAPLSLEAVIAQSSLRWSERSSFRVAFLTTRSTIDAAVNYLGSSERRRIGIWSPSSKAISSRSSSSSLRLGLSGTTSTIGQKRPSEEAEASTRARKSFPEPHFKVFREFRGTSYADRYALLCQRLVLERHYDSACLLLSSKKTGPLGDYREPDRELSFRVFATKLVGHVSAFLKLNQ
jgi:hypothetical protein